MDEPRDEGLTLPETTMRVLLVERSTEIFSSLVQFGRDQPITLITTAKPQDAVELLEACSADVVICCYEVGDEKVIDFLEMVRFRYPGTLRALVTQHLRPLALLEAVNRAGVQKLVLTSVAEVQLTEMLAEVLAEGVRHWIAAARLPPGPGECSRPSLVSPAGSDAELDGALL